MKKYILLLLVSIAICTTSGSSAMEKDLAEEVRKTPQIHLIIPPEQMETINRMKLIETFFPHLACEVPLIRLKEEFDVAKGYLDLSMKYNKLLYAAALSGARRELVENSQRVLKGLLTYIDTLQGPSCDSFRSSEDQKAFKVNAYEAQHSIAQNHLMLLIATILTPNLKNDSLTINKHVQEIKKIKECLSENSHYRKKLQEAIKDAQESVPALLPLFNPQMQLKSPQTRKQRGGRIEQQRTANYYQKNYQKLSPLILQDSFQGVEGFDTYFQVNVKNILAKHLALSLKKISQEEYVSQVQKLTEEYAAVEKKGLAFKAWLGLATPSPSENLTSEELTDLYRLFCQRYTLPQQNPLQLLESSIFMFIQANKVEEALMRTEALKTFLLEKGPLSDSFISLRASVMALNGDSEEWRKLLEDKRKKAQQEKADAEKQQISQIKEQQEKRKKEQENAAELKKITQVIPVKKIIQGPVDTVDVINETPVSSAVETKPKSEPEILIPREKTKTRNPAWESADKDKPLNSSKSLSSATIETPKALKDYPLSNTAFKTYQKIRRGDWKFTRQNLYNLFQKLKCSVDISQGKGVHGKISQPLNMTITNDEGFVAVIPEFIHGEVPFPLTVPNWDDNWSGIVPPYMRRAILKALDYLDATDETVHK